MLPALQRRAPLRRRRRPPRPIRRRLPLRRDGQHAGGFRHRDRRGATCRAARPRCGDLRPVARTRQRQIRPSYRQQERPDADRRVLLRPQLQAAVDRRRQGRRQRQSGDCLPRPRRYRRAVSVRLSGAEFRRAFNAGRSRQCRDPTDHVGHYLCASCQHRARRLVARDGGCRLRQSGAGAGRRAGHRRRRQGHGDRARFFRAAYAGLSGAQGQACRNPRRPDSTKPSRRSRADRCSRSACRTIACRNCASGSAFSATAAPLTTRRSPKR